ncbi:MAG TPA: glutamate--tRNA ligase, partial [Tepidiformaceae bacterium]|nr:glutamate--tRNA ligase [Tepidiformaceae bacterium]
MNRELTAVRTRYAPSPTGDPHIGNIRSALFSWAMARANGGTFLLRIEDTDRNRLVETSLQAIYDSLHWLGLEWDEGPGAGGAHEPYFQSQRLPLYQKAAMSLIEKGRAYRCFCTPERLDKLRAAQTAAKQPPGYDGLCRDVPLTESEKRAQGERFVVRFKMRREGETVLDDLVRGKVVFENKLQDDFVMLKSDGYPTYHLAVVVDDTEMEISHAIRGDEWISSAPKHIQLYEALGWDPPQWVHLPLILGTDHKKLSKRMGDVSTLDYRDKGYLPEAMVNFLAFLGWSLDDKTSLITLDDLQRHFSLERVVPNPAVFDIDRLNYLNGYYIREMAEERWNATIAGWCDRGLPPSIPRPIDAGLLAAVAPLLRERVALLSEIAPMVEFLWGFEAPEYEPAMLAAKLGGDGQRALQVVDAALVALDAIPDARWDKA